MSASDTYYGLFTSESGQGFRWRLKDEGVRLVAGQIEWWVGADSVRLPLDRITDIRLSVTPALRNSFAGVCTITFDRFERVAVHSATAFGLPDHGRADEYRRFVHDLHRALPEDARRRIAFHAGGEGADNPLRRALGYGLIAVCALGALAALFTGTFRGVVVAGLVGVVMIWPLVRMLQTGRGEGGYIPDHIPEDLLP